CMALCGQGQACLPRLCQHARMTELTDSARADHPGPVSVAFAEAMFPAGETLPAPDATALATQVAGYVAGRPLLRGLLSLGLGWLEWRGRRHLGSRFSRAAVAPRRALLDALAPTLISGLLLRLVSLPFRAAYVLDSERAARMGVPRIQVPEQIETFRWQQQITRAAELEEDQTLDAD